jgi:hypothetical protein
LSEEEKIALLKRVQKGRVKLTPFKKDRIESIIADFEATNVYEDQFLKDLEEGLKKSSIYR